MSFLAFRSPRLSRVAETEMTQYVRRPRYTRLARAWHRLGRYRLAVGVVILGCVVLSFLHAFHP